MDRPVSFPAWKASLAQAPLTSQLKVAYTREILTFLKHCKESHAAATVAVAKQYLAWREKQSNGPAREALRWFYREGRHAEAGGTGPVAAARGPAEITASEAGADRSTIKPASTRAEAPGPALPAPWPQSTRRPMEPPPAASDLGSAPWEKDLIKAIRERGFLWRRV